MKKLAVKLFLVATTVFVLAGCTTVHVYNNPSPERIAKEDEAENASCGIKNVQIEGSEDTCGKLVGDSKEAKQAIKLLETARNTVGDKTKTLEELWLVLAKTKSLELKDLGTNLTEIRLLIFYGFIEEAKKWPANSRERFAALKKAKEAWERMFPAELADACSELNEEENEGFCLGMNLFEETSL